MTVDPAIAEIRGDQMKTQAVVSNVVRNAAKYTRDGSVEVICTPVKAAGVDAVRIEVRDTGIGIDAKDLPNIFEQFAVVDDETSTKYGGTGVGLALTRELCRMMGGTIEATSTLGEGSTFAITLPVVMSERAPESAPLREILAIEKSLYPDGRCPEQNPDVVSQKVA